MNIIVDTTGKSLRSRLFYRLETMSEISIRRRVYVPIIVCNLKGNRYICRPVLFHTKKSVHR